MDSYTREVILKRLTKNNVYDNYNESLINKLIGSLKQPKIRQIMEMGHSIKT